MKNKTECTFHKVLYHISIFNCLFDWFNMLKNSLNLPENSTVVGNNYINMLKVLFLPYYDIFYVSVYIKVILRVLVCQ